MGIILVIMGSPVSVVAVNCPLCSVILITIKSIRLEDRGEALQDSMPLNVVMDISIVATKSLMKNLEVGSQGMV